MLRLGIIGVDSSHSVEFTSRINHLDIASQYCVEGARVTGIWADPECCSGSRARKFTSRLHGWDIPFVASLDQLFQESDAALILSVQGRKHEDQVQACLAAGLPCFVDKPLACDLSAAQRIAAFSQHSGKLCWSSSALRFAEETINCRNLLRTSQPELSTWGPALLSEENPGLFHYGIHGIELLLSLMGIGAEWVQSRSGQSGELITIGWADGRIGTYRGLRTASRRYGLQAFTPERMIMEEVSTRYAYRNLCQTIIQAFKDDVAPVPLAETIEIITIIAAANTSLDQGGAVIPIDGSRTD